jgi:hypothetical protein
MHRLSLLIASLLVCLVAAAVRADDVGVDDVRMFIAPVMGQNMSIHSDFEGSSYDRGDQVSRHDRFGFGYYHSLHALYAGQGSPLWGIELGFDRVRQEAFDLEYKASSQVIDGMVGWAWPVSPQLHIEAALVAGGGRVSWRRTEALEDESFVYEYGYRAGGHWTFANGLQVGIDARYQIMKSEGLFVTTTEDIPVERVKFIIDGFGVAIDLGYRF